MFVHNATLFGSFPRPSLGAEEKIRVPTAGLELGNR